MKRLLFITITLLFYIFKPAAGQKIPLDNYTVQNGLPQNSVFDIVQDAEGFLWFATQVGIARFDGYDFQYINASDGLPDNYVNCLMSDPSGKMWIGTEGGVAVYSRGEIKIYNVSSGLVDNRVDRLQMDYTGNVWVGTAYGISIISGDTVINYSDEDALGSNLITDIFIDGYRRIHVATSKGVTVFRSPSDYQRILSGYTVRDVEQAGDGTIWYATQESGIAVSDSGTIRWLDKSSGLGDSIILSLMLDAEGRMWCATYQAGLYRYTDGRFNKIKTGLENDPVVLEIYQDRLRRVWLRTPENGVWLVEKDHFQHIRQLNNLTQNNVQVIYEDWNGNIWLGTLGGVSKYGRVIFEIWDTDFGLPDNAILSVFSDSEDRIWFGTYGYLLQKRQDDSFTIYEPGDEFEYPPAFLSFAESPTHEIWIGSDLGLLKMKGNRLQRYSELFGQDKPSVYDLEFSESGVLWCASDSGIFLVKGNNLDSIKSDRGLVNNRVNALEIYKNVVYCATEGGISLFDIGGSHIRNLTVQDGLPADICLDITIDEHGNPWVVTTKGLVRIDANEGWIIKKYSVDEGLTSENIYSVKFEDTTRLWIGNIRGIDVLDIASGELEHYGYDEGFTPLETNSRAIARSRNGHMWIGTVSGLAHYMPENNHRDTSPPYIIVYPPLLNGKSADLSIYADGLDENGLPEQMELPFNRNSLTFRYTGIHLTIPGKNRFSYILDPYDDAWSDPSTQRMAEYKKLPHGSYTFRLKAANLDGYYSAEPFEFSFVVNPPFWRTPWFIMLEILAGILLIYGFIKYRERQLIREKRILSQKVAERTREIEDQKVEIEAQRDEIEQQKNFVEHQRDRIALQNKEITDSIIYAKRIQQAALPGDESIKQILPEHFILFRPRDIVSGDFYWFTKKDGLIIACAADCTGHGVPGAFMSLLGLTFFNEIVNKDNTIRADEILNSLRKYIITALSHRDQYGDTNDGMDLSLAVINDSEMTLEFSGAYNPLIVIRNSEIIEIKGDKMPIGKHVNEHVPFTRHQLNLERNDRIYMFSDGYADQFGGQDGSKYKSKPFKRLLLEVSQKPMEEQREILDEELMEWMGVHDQVDDILVMGLKLK